MIKHDIKTDSSGGNTVRRTSNRPRSREVTTDARNRIVQPGSKWKTDSRSTKTSTITRNRACYCSVSRKTSHGSRKISSAHPTRWKRRRVKVRINPFSPAWQLFVFDFLSSFRIKIFDCFLISVLTVEN